MKKLFFAFSAFILFASVAFSQVPSSVVVFSQEGERFYVVVDGIRQNDTPQTNVRVTGLTGPRYLFKVIFENEQIPAIDKNVMTRDVDEIPQDMTYVVKKNNKGVYDMKINSFEPAKGEGYAPVQNQYEAPLTTVNTSTGTGVQNTSMEVTTTTVEQNVVSDPNAVNMNVNVVDPVTGESVNMNMNVNTNVTGMQTTSSTTITTTTTTTTTTSGDVIVTDPVQPDYYVMPGYNGPIGCHWPMSDMDFGGARQSINSKSFESDKLTIAKQILGSNCMTCEQIKQIMLLFSFEDSRLEFAKYAYGYVYDPGNFYKLNDAFTFSSSIDELNDYINGH